jgi:hypothetical protein
MRWEEKLQILNTLTPTSLRIIEPGKWVISAPNRGFSFGSGGALFAYGTGTTPQAAVEDDWDRMMDGKDGYVVIDYFTDHPKYYQWDRCIWREVKLA